MTPTGFNMTRRRFLFLGAAAGIAAPLLTDMAFPVPEAVAGETVNPATDTPSGPTGPSCKGCQLCTIFFSNCLAVNNRVCWREAGAKGSGGALT